MNSDIDAKRLRELALRAAHTGMPVHTRFLEPPLEGQARAAARAAGCAVDFSGGYPGAERRVAAFFTDSPGNFPIERLKLSWRAEYGSPGHRDILGALMALGIARETFGDISVRGDCALIFAHADIAEYLLSSLESAGRARLSVARDDAEFVEGEPGGEAVYRTVPSDRLDALLQQAFRLSRDASQKLVLSERVKVNHVPVAQPDRRLSEGDLISVRGLGRIRLSEVVGATKKGRLGVRIIVFGK